MWVPLLLALRLNTLLQRTPPATAPQIIMQSVLLRKPDGPGLSTFPSSLPTFVPREGLRLPAVVSPLKPRPPLMRRLVAEAVGTGFIVGGGCGATCALQSAAPSCFAMASMWGGIVAVAVYLLRSVSGAHFNPAVTLAFAFNRVGPYQGPKEVLSYIMAQCTGATIASALMSAYFLPSVAATQVRTLPASARVESPLGSPRRHPAPLRWLPRASTSHAGASFSRLLTA